MQTGNAVEYPRKFARFPIAMEMESALRRKPYVPFCRHFSVGNFSSSLSIRSDTGEFLTFPRLHDSDRMWRRLFRKSPRAC
jgi:hypothetical protein